LELLSADLAVEPAAARLLVELDFDGLFVVAEEACECRREAFALGKSRASQPWVSCKMVVMMGGTFLGPWGLLELLRLPIVTVAWDLGSVARWDADGNRVVVFRGWPIVRYVQKDTLNCARSRCAK
jgi:hypothetical protein